MTRKALTIEEILAMIEDEDDGIDTVCVVPPDRIDEVTDEEYIDDNEIPINDNQTALQEVAGTFEIYRSDQDEPLQDMIITDQPTTSAAAMPPTKRAKITDSPLRTFKEPKWTQRNDRSGNFQFALQTNTDELLAVRSKLFSEIKESSPLQLFEKIFDEEMLDFIINESNIYAQQKQINISLNKNILRRFLGILILSGFNTLPSIEDYWSNDPCLGNSIVKQSMPRKMFKDIKRTIHFNNNNNLDINDKLTKVRPLVEMANKKYMQFGIWSTDLSIDEQMVPYFGRHSCKMYIRNKPIRFGYKLWCLCSANGYLYSCIPYAGASDNYDRQIGLGADVVLRLLENVENPNCHRVYFDNFFTSYQLMCLLSEKKFCASGTVRTNRIGKAPLKTGNQLNRGDSDFQYDQTNNILVCRWADNKEVTICTNFDQIQPMHSVKRWKKKEKQFGTYQQPNMFYNYNQGMGGVDLHDNAVQNYRINIRSKKWYWPFFISVLSSSVVNAWKLYCFVAKERNEKPMPQKNFRVIIAKELLLSSKRLENSPEFSPRNLPRVDCEHIPVEQKDGKPRRCRLKSCGKPIKWMCKKCNVHLHPKCFEAYHQN